MLNAAIVRRYSWIWIVAVAALAGSIGFTINWLTATLIGLLAGLSLSGSV
jgi:hypothetical protein